MIASLFDSPTVLVGGLVLAFLGALSCGLYADHKNEIERERQWNEFRTACMQDRKEYECVAMWRAGNVNSQTEVIPMPILIPVGR
jgi:hypothetical protein